MRVYEPYIGLEFTGRKMDERFARTEALIGKEGMARLASARVAVFGIGGVGSYVVEALARSGIGALDLVDHDRVDITNINRQLIATTKTVGRLKVDVAKERILEINPYAQVRCYPHFFLPETAGQFDFSAYQYVVDAIDTVSGKIALIMRAKSAGVPVISSMGAGNKMDPSGFMVADIYETSVCPLAKVMRRELKKRGVEHLKVAYSKEKPYMPQNGRMEHTGDENAKNAKEVKEGGETNVRRAAFGSNAFVPAAAGLVIAGEVVKDLK